MTEGAGGPCHLHHGSGYAQPHESPPASRKCNRWNPAACNLADGAQVTWRPVKPRMLVPCCSGQGAPRPVSCSTVGSITRMHREGRAMSARACRWLPPLCPPRAPAAHPAGARPGVRPQRGGAGDDGMVWAGSRGGCDGPRVSHVGALADDLLRGRGCHPSHRLCRCC